MELNEIKTRNELADFLHIERKTLTNVLYNKHVDSYYYSFEIPKKSGGTRKIHAPQNVLKIIQKKLSIALYNYRDYICKENKINLNISHAFERNKGIITNAYIHKNKRYIINIDLKDFFDSFHFGRVRGFFKNNKYFQLPLEVSTIIAQLVCYKGKLPQGAPTSPIITNFICNVLDYKILQLAKKYHLDYTRYADDLTFSTNDKKFLDKYEQFYNSLNRIISQNGFEINSKKTRIVYYNSRQTVTGLVVNKKININHLYYKNVRAMANNLYKNGSFFIDENEGNIAQLEGRFSFINEVDKYNNKYNNMIQNKAEKKFFKLCSREKEFQKFLFYKYFYMNSKPLIITEGKTDRNYIIAALKNLYKEYPKLIEKKTNGKFDFKVSFLKRSKRLSFYFNMSIDGADSMRSIYCFYSDYDNKTNYPNYFEYFNNISWSKAKNPVILVFDNELKTKGKPLNKFSEMCKCRLDGFEKGGNVKVIDNGNLYLVTHQIVKGKESEIEDLFDSETLKHKINGKEFCRKSEFNVNKYYGKDHFSQYILSNYENIDFSNFKPLLDNINEIICNYEK